MLFQLQFYSEQILDINRRCMMGYADYTNAAILGGKKQFKAAKLWE